MELSAMTLLVGSPVKTCPRYDL